VIGFLDPLPVSFTHRSAYNNVMDTIPTNADTAAVFDGIADLLEAKGENQFKIRAYRNAVRTLESLNEPVADIESRGELRQVPRFGEAITAKIGEILQTGTCDLYERLKAEQNASSPLDMQEGSPNGTADDEEIASPW
jgi:DNA polymerase/3'-5' exonuclease PolX